MNTTLPKIGIVYLQYYHNETDISDLVSSMRNISYPKNQIELIVVANPHPEHGSFVRHLEDVIMPLSEKDLPHVTILPQETNTGFAGGNNVGTQKALEFGCEYIIYHNNDGFFALNALEPMVGAFSDPKVGIVQPLVLLHPETSLINSAGNCFHYLGFGFMDEYRTPVSSLPLPKTKEVAYASGSSMMVRSDLIREYGAWVDYFFMYHEDLEWSLRLRSLGYKILLVSDSVFYHKYQFGRSIQKFYYMERNRYGTMLIFFKWPTLILLAPMALALELGLILFAIRGGWFKKRIDIYQYWLNPKNWKPWLRDRKKMQSIRTVSDRYLLSFSVSGIHFQDAQTDNWMVNYIANPIMKVYYWVIVKGLIRW